MTPSVSKQLIEALKKSLLEVEASSGVSSDDPAFVALKSFILQRIADLELAKERPIPISEAKVENPPSDATELPSEAA